MAKETQESACMAAMATSALLDFSVSSSNLIYIAVGAGSRRFGSNWKNY